jgi:O-antigen/teichoic acid export membrane protein
VKVLPQWVKTNSVILVNAGSLVGTTGVTSVLGFVYWWVAAREFSPDAVGLASATVSAMTLLGTFGVLGLGTLLIGELPRQRGKEASLISAALIVVGGVGGCLGFAFAVVARYLLPGFQVLSASMGNIALFAFGVSLTAITIVLDQALIGLLRGSLQLWRNTIFASVKLAALLIVSVWLARVTGMTIYATWMVGNFLSLLSLGGFLMVKGRARGILPEWGLLRKLGFFAIKQHALNLTLQAPPLILPVLITVLLSAATNAWFFVSWSLAGLANIVSSALTMTLYAVSSAQHNVLAHKIRLTLSLAFVACALANCVLLLETRQILELFGHSYAEQSVWSLRILSLESFPFIIKDHYIVVNRIQGRVVHATRVTIATGLLELGGALLGARFGGLTGVSLGWFVAVCIEVMFMFRTVYRAVQPINASSNRDQLSQNALPDAGSRKISMLADEPGLR